MTGKIIYTALFVKDVSDLINRFPSKHQKVFAHHSTIAFRPESLDGLEIGKEYSIKIMGRVFDDKGDALLVENPKSKNQHPHITLSCAEGISPTYSSEMISRATENNTIDYFVDEVKIIEGYFDGDKDVVNL